MIMIITRGMRIYSSAIIIIIIIIYAIKISHKVHVDSWTTTTTINARRRCIRMRYTTERTHWTYMIPCNIYNYWIIVHLNCCLSIVAASCYSANWPCRSMSIHQMQFPCSICSSFVTKSLFCICCFKHCHPILAYISHHT